MGDDSVSLTAAGVLDVQAAVQNAIHNVLGPGDPSSSLSSAQDILNLDTSLKIKFKKLTKDIQKGLEDVAKNIVSAVGASSQQSAGVASILHGDETESPLNRMASTLDEIHAFLVEKFKPTGLGSEDDNKGMLEKVKKDKEEQKREDKKDDNRGGSVFLGGTIVAATLMSIKDYLEETWVGLAQRFLKPFVAVQLAIKGLPKSLSGLSLNFQRFTSQIAAKFPRLSKAMTNLMKPIRWLTTKVKGFGRSITSAVKNFNFKKIFAPVTKWLSKLGGTAGFGKLFKWLSPIGGLLKKLAFPITLLFEAFEAFKMIFVGSFTKNAEAMAESISEKGVLGRAWYGFTHMFQTIAAAVKTQFDTIMQTFDILFSDHPDGMVGKLKNIGEIILTPIKTMFEDFIIYPIQKALAFLPDWMIKVADPDDVAADQAARGLIGSENDETAEQRAANELGFDKEKKIRDKVQADKFGVTVDEWNQFKKDRKGKPDTYGIEDWKNEKQNKVNQSSALPKPNTTGPYQGAGSPHGQALLQQNSAQYNTTFEVQFPNAGDILNQ